MMHQRPQLILPVSLLSLGFTGLASAATLSLDFQPAGGTTAAGFLAFEATNQDASAGATANYTEFGSTITVTLTTSNLPDGSADFRSVERNGGDSATNVANDWIGADTRAGGVDVTMTLSISGLPAGLYNWRSGHHDGGGASGTGNGNIQGLADYSFTDATGTAVVPNGIDLTRNDLGEAPSFFSRDFTSDGSDIVVTFTMDEGQGDVGDSNAIFIHMNSLEISEAIPEPSTGLLSILGLCGLLYRRQR